MSENNIDINNIDDINNDNNNNDNYNSNDNNNNNNNNMNDGDNDNDNDSSDINLSPAQIEQKIHSIDDFRVEKKLYVDKVHVKLIYPKTSKMAYIIEEYTDYTHAEDQITSFDRPYKLDELIKHGVKSDEYSGNELLWGKNSINIYSIKYIDDFVKLAKTVGDDTVKICESDDTPIMLESKNLRMLIAQRKWGRDV